MATTRCSLIISVMVAGPANTPGAAWIQGMPPGGTPRWASPCLCPSWGLVSPWRKQVIRFAVPCGALPRAPGSQAHVSCTGRSTLGHTRAHTHLH